MPQAGPASAVLAGGLLLYLAGTGGIIPLWNAFSGPPSTWAAAVQKLDWAGKLFGIALTTLLLSFFDPTVASSFMTLVILFWVLNIARGKAKA